MSIGCKAQASFNDALIKFNDKMSTFNGSVNKGAGLTGNSGMDYKKNDFAPDTKIDYQQKDFIPNSPTLDYNKDYSPNNPINIASKNMGGGMPMIDYGIKDFQPNIPIENPNAVNEDNCGEICLP